MVGRVANHLEGMAIRVAGNYLNRAHVPNPHVWTCYDHMVITLWGEHYASIKLLKDPSDNACDYEHSLLMPERLRRRCKRCSENPRNSSLRTLARGGAVLSSTSTKQCFNVNLNSVHIDVRNAITSIAKQSVAIRHRRHALSTNALRRALSTCNA